MRLFFLPSRTSVIPTHLAPDNALVRLADELDPLQWRVERDDVDRRVRFSRRISYRNSFLPYATAISQPAPHGANVVVSLRLHKFVSVFMTFFLGFAMLLVTVDLGAALFGETAPIPFLFNAVIIAGFGLALPWAAFQGEAGRYERACDAALPAPPAPPKVIETVGPLR
jgi:hypothetical protein